MNLKRWIPILLLLSVLLSGCLDAINPTSGKLTLKDLKFFTNLTTALDVANTSGEPVFLYFRSETCGWCNKFEEESFTNKSIIGMLSNNFMIITIDVNKQKNITRFYGVRGTPHELFLYPNGTEIKRLPGYVDNQTFLITINEIALLTRGLKNET
jgi:thioredoxin 1